MDAGSNSKGETEVPKINKIEVTNTTPAMKFSQEEQAYHKHLTLGIEEKLQKNRMIKDIKLTIRQPAEKPSLSGWERKYNLHLPSDLKDYYLSTNGFKLTWSLEHAGDHLKIGEMNINPITQLLPLESLDPSESSSRGGTGQMKKSSNDPRKNCRPLYSSSGNRDGSSNPNKVSPLGASLEDGNDFGNFQVFFSDLRLTMESNGQIKSHNPGGLFLLPNDKAFFLDQNRYGWICLIYPEASNKSDCNQQSSPRSVTEPSGSIAIPEPSVEIWFLDSSFQWHYLAPTFSHYYRMMLFHLGLPQWQYRFTPYGLSSWAEQMFWLVAPHLLTPPKISKFPSIYHAGGLWSTEVPAEAASPNPTCNVLSSQIFKRKKKDKDKAT